MTRSTPERTCADCGRSKQLAARGLCAGCYTRFRRSGDFQHVDKPTLAARVASFIAPSPSGCQRWTGAHTNTGYGTIFVEGKTLLAHRVNYELNVGPIPAGAELDHLCRVRDCVYPPHLEPVTPDENKKRMGSAVTHCKRAGHPFTPENTMVTPAGRRRCRECHRLRLRAARGQAVA